MIVDSNVTVNRIHSISHDKGLEPYDSRVAFGDFVKTERNKRGWKVRELARRTKIAPGTISKIELGDIRTPKQESVEAFARAFHIPYSVMDRILRGLDPYEEDAPPLTPDLAALLAAVSQLSPEQQAALRVVAESMAASGPKGT